ncbi:pimeloyl-ACP methyl ester carboxylesterase [Arthrobacter pigmenti]|uniref:Pimeloyl-ACP methyl ester carboxylesterase n=1 Tax=Arthrobacter pigmenti TaxID=271432 RepID=A0A846RQ80_9MICC|nr:alpha/beta hydrolase [Arthrobacter pigmenti]NJC22554.1 pimeloyl-ACP methyl ester carboxylesterase [Arthrobacter pigmenti]
MKSERVVFVHGAGNFGAAAWTRQHGMALEFDCLFVRRHGFHPVAAPLPTDFAQDQRIVAEALGSGGHLVAASQGAVAAMMVAVERPELVRSLTLAEPACLSLTESLPATAAHKARVQPLFDRAGELTDEEFNREFVRLVFAAEPRTLDTPEAKRAARRLRLQAPPWTAPLHIVPGVPTLVLTGGWEPLYEEVAGYLAETGARHTVAGGGHRPQDTPAGADLISGFIRTHSRKAA